jgi:hypothetical protein
MNLVNPYRFATGPNDPHFASVVLLLHGDGTNGSTDIIDSSALELTQTANTGVITSTTDPKFGTASLSCSGSNAVTFPAGSHWAFGNGDFTVEYWIKTSNTAGQIFGLRAYVQGAWNVILYNSRLYWQRFITDGNLYSVSFSAYLGLWTHVAHVRSGTTHKMYINGIEVSSVTDSYNYNNSSNTLLVGGMSGGNGNFTGGLEIRVTKGVARYTADFTPPTAAFPDS